MSVSLQLYARNALYMRRACATLCGVPGTTFAERREWGLASTEAAAYASIALAATRGAGRDEPAAMKSVSPAWNTRKSTRQAGLSRFMPHARQRV